MSAGNITGTPPEPLFRARLTPNRSLGPNGFAAVMAVLGLASAALGTAFLMMGAWPVVGFFGLDVLLVYLAFRASFRAARAYEEVEVAADRLDIRAVDPAGRASRFRFNPYWARLELDRAPDRRVTVLRVASHGERLTIARFLGAEARERFAEALSAALARVRAGPRADGD